MMNYTAYLTKSKEVCDLLSNALEIEKQEWLKTEGVKEVNLHHGKLYTDASIPGIYHNQDYWYAVICVHGTSVESYRLIVA